jgi:leader peptidase (prepilin peptidase)/N-methyltransferase
MGTAYVYFLVCLFGACIGSFLNVVIYRLPKGTFLSKSRSYCPSCGKTLKARDLVPVFSWIFLRGKCRFCAARISPRYPMVEIGCAGLAALALWRYGFTWNSLIAFGASVLALAVALIDHDTMEIPDALVIALIPFAVGAIWAAPEVALWERAVGFVVVSVPMLVLGILIKGAFGGGDVKLMAVCGFLLGWQALLAAFFLALVTGGGLSVYLILSKKAKRGAQIAFGPHLCLGIGVCLFFGQEILRLYLGLF